MDNTKSNDMLLATLSNPNAGTYDFVSNGLKPENTQLLDKETYKSKEYIKNQFTNAEGKFDEKTFDAAYNMALFNFNQISSEEAIKKLDEVEYDVGDWTRPTASKTRSVSIKYSKDNNPFWNLYSRDGFDSVTQNNLSIREIAQKGRIHDVEKNTWSERSADDLGIFSKFFGDTLVYAQWDDDGTHVDGVSGNTVKHTKGDWKTDEYGQLHLEKLGNREVYGKQVVNPSDILTTDGSLFNKFDFFDSDGREKSLGGTAVKTLVEIAPLLIPGVNTYYGGMKAVVGLAAVLPTFYKSLEGLLIGDTRNYGNDPITKAEGWLAKFKTTSTSDAGSAGLFNPEQMSSMVSAIFSQIYEQRAMASISNVLMKPSKLLDSKTAGLQLKMTIAAHQAASSKGIDAGKAIARAVENLPELQAAIAKQSSLAKSLSLGYMALTSSSEIYGEALESGYDRRTAGFASLLAAGGQYGIMMNNRMGDWFLDKTTGYNVETNRALMHKSIKPWLAEIDKIITDGKLPMAAKKMKLAGIVSKAQSGLKTFFTEPSVIGEGMWKNSLVEGVEEVTEELVMDMAKGIVDTMSYLGMTKKKGDFRTVERFQTGEAFQEYLSNFVGGVIGGSLFEMERTVISPWFLNKGKFTPETAKSVYELVAGGQKSELIEIIKKESKKLSNDSLSYVQDADGENFLPKEGASHSDVVSQAAISMVEHLAGIMGSEGLILTDEEIINKAIKNEWQIMELEKSRVENKHIGLEGLLLEDYKRNALALTMGKSEADNNEKIAKLSPSAKDTKIPDSKIDPDKDYVKEQRQIVKDILDGKRNMHYFDQMVTYLNPEIREVFASLDKENFIQAKFKVSYKSLPDKGIGLNKQGADEEWQKFQDSTDLLGKLETVTAAYKEWEKLLNPAIADTIDSGYYDMKREMVKHIEDLDITIRNFNTSSMEHRNEIIDNFLTINTRIQAMKGVKVMPWEAYRIKVAQTVFDEGLVKKRVQNDAGEIVNIDYTPEELEALNQDGVSLKQEIMNNFDDIARNFPSTAFDFDYIVHNYNAAVSSRNEETLSRIDALRKSSGDPAENQRKIEELEKGILQHTILMSDSSDSMKAFEADNLENFEIEKENILGGEDTLVYRYRDLKPYQKTYMDKKTPISLESEIGKVQTGATSLDQLSKLEKLTLLNNLDKRGVLAQTILENKNNTSLPTDIDILRTNLGNGESDVSPLESTIFGFLESNITASTGVLQDSKAQEKLEKVTELEEKYAKNKRDSLPQIFKLHNMAFDYLVSTIEEGNFDEEHFLRAKIMYEDEMSSISKRMFNNMKTITNEDLLYWVTNKVDLWSIVNEFISDLAVADEDNPFAPTPEITFEELIEAHEKQPLFNGSKEHTLLRDILTNNFEPTDTLSFIAETISNWESAIKRSAKDFATLIKFTQLDPSKVKSNPIFNLIRNYAMVMNTNPDSKINTVFDIFEREELSYKGSSGAAAFISDTVRPQDLQQSLDMLDMIKTVINSMSTTQLFGDDMNGFIAMRQNFAKNQGIEDDVTSLRTINSDQAALMNKEIDVLRTKIKFMKDLAEVNATRISAEQKAIDHQMTIVNTEIWKDLSSKTSLIDIIPTNFRAILTSDIPAQEKLMQLETAFFDHNKRDKLAAFKKILQYELQNIDPEAKSAYTKTTTRGEVSAYNMAMYFATSLSIRSEDHLKRQGISLAGIINKAPFYLQEYASKITKATTQDPELFAAIYEVHQDVTKDNADFITLILGGAGTGKTTVAIAQTIDIIRQSNSASRIWLAAPSMKQAEKLTADTFKSIGDTNLAVTTLDTNALFSMFGEEIKNIRSQIMKELKDPENTSNQYISISNRLIKFKMSEDWVTAIDFKNLPNLLVFDEVTHLSRAELMLLNFISRASYNHDSSSFMKVVGAGDPNQMGFKTKVGDTYVEYNVGGLQAMYTPYLTTTVRANNGQKRANNDMLLGVVDYAGDLYRAETKKNDTDYKRSDDELFQYLTDVNNLTALSFYKDEKRLNGDYIAKSYNDIANLEIIKRAIKANEEEADPNKPPITVGVLTSDGVIDPSMQQALDSAGIPAANIEIHTVDSVQGSESDYFIFDMKVIPPFDKLKDILKSFYTYTLRSRSGSIIFDTENTLQEKLNITNAKQDEYPVFYELMTEDAVNKLKKERIEEIKVMVKGDEISANDNFKWKVGANVIPVSEPGEVIIPEIEDSVQLKNDENHYITSEAESEKNVFPDGEFGAMAHSFYNNPSAELEYKDGRPVSLKRDANNLIKMDLNGNKNVSDPELLQNIIEEWGRLRMHILRNDKAYVQVTDYPNFFTHIFGASIRNVNIELLITASLFDAKLNTPFQKQGFNALKLPQDGVGLFKNITARLTQGEVGDPSAKTHYITLATLTSDDTFINEGLKYYKGDKTAITNSVLAASKAIKDTLDDLVARKQPNFVVLDTIQQKEISLITSTRLVGKSKDGVSHKLTDLRYLFPGMQFSEIKILPNSLAEFTQTLNKYNFGAERTPEQIHKMFYGTKNDDATTNPDGTKNNDATVKTRGLSGKPYIVVTFGNDLGGTKGSKTSAKLVPISAKGRDMKTIMEEVAKLKAEINASVNDHFKADEDGNVLLTDVEYVVKPEFNAKAETLLDKSQMLDILMKWHDTKPTDLTIQGKKFEGSLLDLLTYEITIQGVGSTVTKSFLHVLENFKNTSDGKLTLASEKFIKVLDLIKKYGTGKGAKANIIKNMGSNVGWAWNFHNIFAVGDILMKRKNKVFNLAALQIELGNKEALQESDYDIFATFAKALLDTEKGTTFYYSIPILPNKTTREVNPLISGKTGFKEEFFGDRFFINTTPEAERVIIPLKYLTGSKTKAGTAGNQSTKTPTPLIDSATKAFPEFGSIITLLQDYEGAADAIEAFLVINNYNAVNEINDKIEILQNSLSVLAGMTIGTEHINNLSALSMDLKTNHYKDSKASLITLFPNMPSLSKIANNYKVSQAILDGYSALITGKRAAEWSEARQLTEVLESLGLSNNIGTYGAVDFFQFFEFFGQNLTPEDRTRLISEMDPEYKRDRIKEMREVANELTQCGKV